MSNVGPQLTVKPIAGALGAEIHGVDLLSNVSDAELAHIREIWLQYSVVFFRDQPLPPKDLSAFARRFGEVVHYPFLKGLDEAPEVITVAKLEHQTRPEFTCRFNWRPGSIAFWDNRCALHNPVNDYHGQRRIMHRVTLAGDRPQ